MKTAEIRRLRKAIRKLDRATSRCIEKSCCGVTLAQCHVLLELEAAGGITTLGLARELQLDKSTVSLTVDGLVRQGMVARMPDPGDRRVTRLSLTESGQKTCDAINEVNDELIGEVLGRIPRGRRRAVVADFAMFVDALAGDGGDEA